MSWLDNPKPYEDAIIEVVSEHMKTYGNDLTLASFPSVNYVSKGDGYPNWRHPNSRPDQLPKKKQYRADQHHQGNTHR